MSRGRRRSRAISSPTPPDPDRVESRLDFGRELGRARAAAGGRTVRELAKSIDIPPATLGGYLSGRHLPPVSQQQRTVALLQALGISEPDEVARWLRALDRARRASDGRVAQAPPPYRGLTPYQPEDSEWFFGRTHSIANIVSKLSEIGSGLLLVTGPSGSGKSSLLRAGVIPALRRQRHASCAVMTPGSDPLADFEACLAALGGPVRVVVVDQFEEVFTACTAGGRSDFLDRLARVRDERLLVVLVLRADFYAAAADEMVLLPVLRDAQFVVGPMRSEDIRHIVVQPARQAGIAVQEGLVDLVLADLRPRDVANRAYDAGALPLLSHALLASWEHSQRNELTIADYQRSGGIDGAVRQTAEELLQTLTSSELEETRRIFVRLVNLDDETTLSRRRMSRTELASLATVAHTGDDTPATGNRVVDLFISRRLITARQDSIEISHEALLSAWPRLQEWLAEDRAGLRLHRELTDAANRWAAAREPTELLSGRPLHEIERWATDNPADLNRLERDYLDGSVTAHRRDTRAERARARRLRLVTTVAVCFALVAGGLTMVAVRAQHRATAETRDATRARDTADSRAAAVEASRLRETSPGLATQVALAGYQVAPTEDARSAVIDSTAAPDPVRIVGPAGPVQALAAGPGDRLLAATGGDGRVHLWSLADPDRPRALATIGPVDRSAVQFALAISPNGRLLVAEGMRNSVEVWDIHNPAHPALLAPSLPGAAGTIFGLAFSPDGTMLAAAGGNASVALWNMRDPSQPTSLGRLLGAKDPLQALAFSPDGARLAATGDDGEVREWAVGPHGPRRLVAVMSARSGSDGLSVAFSPDGHSIAAGYKDKTVRIWRAGSSASTPQRSLGGAGSWINAVSWADDGRELIAGSSDETVAYWDVTHDQRIEVLPESHPVTAVLVLADQHLVAVASTDGIVRLWPATGPQLGAATGSVFDICYRSDGRLAAVGYNGSAGGVDLWDLNSAQPRLLHRITDPRTSPDGSIALSPDGHVLASGTLNGTVLLWDVTDPSAPVTLPPLTGARSIVESIAFTPDGRTVIAVDDVGQVLLWHLGRTRPIADLHAFGSKVQDVAVSDHGHLLAAASIDLTARVWNIADPAHPVLLGRIGPLSTGAFSVTFSPDGHTLAVGEGNGVVHLYAVSGNNPPHAVGTPLRGAGDYVYALAFFDDGRRLAASSTNGRLPVWNVADPAKPRQLDLLDAPSGGLFDVAARPHSDELAAGGDGGVVYRWDMDAPADRREMCTRIGTPITRSEWRQYLPGRAYRPPCG